LHPSPLAEAVDHHTSYRTYPLSLTQVAEHTVTVAFNETTPEPSVWTTCTCDDAAGKSITTMWCNHCMAALFLLRDPNHVSFPAINTIVAITTTSTTTITTTTSTTNAVSTTFTTTATACDNSLLLLSSLLQRRALLFKFRFALLLHLLSHAQQEQISQERIRALQVELLQDYYHRGERPRIEYILRQVCRS